MCGRSSDRVLAVDDRVVIGIPEDLLVRSSLLVYLLPLLGLFAGALLAQWLALAESLSFWPPWAVLRRSGGWRAGAAGRARKTRPGSLWWCAPSGRAICRRSKFVDCQGSPRFMRTLKHAMLSLAALLLVVQALVANAQLPEFTELVEQVPRRRW